MAGRDSVDEMEQMMLQMEQMKELIVELKRERQEESEKRRWGGCERNFADGAANSGRESREDGRIGGWMGDSSGGVQHSTAIYSVLPV